MSPIGDRQRDELLLEWLYLRDNRIAFQDIADHYGFPENAVRVAVGKINREYRKSEIPK